MLVALKKLDREEQAIFKVKIVAFDSGNPPLSSFCEVVVRLIDDNDETPFFLNELYVFELLENQQAGIFIGQLEAKDMDITPNDVVMYAFKDEQISVWGKNFKIDEHTGRLFSLRSFDREMKYEYRFEVVAIDRNNRLLSSSCKVVVTIQDINDNEPVFIYPTYENHTLKISSDVKKGYKITRIRASDKDLGRNALIEYEITKGNELKLFEVNSITGDVVLTTDMASVYANLNDSLTLFFSASDKGNPTLKTSSYLNVIVIESWLFDYNYADYGNLIEENNSNSWRWFLRKVMAKKLKRNVVWLLACFFSMIVVILLLAIFIVLWWQRKKRKDHENLNQKSFFSNNHIIENDYRSPKLVSENGIEPNCLQNKTITTEETIDSTIKKIDEKNSTNSPLVSRKIDLTFHSGTMLAFQ